MKKKFMFLSVISLLLANLGAGCGQSLITKEAPTSEPPPLEVLLPSTPAQPQPTQSSGTTQENTGGQNQPDGSTEYEIVATFTPKSLSAFNYNSPMFMDGFIFIGTSTKIGLEGDIAQVLAALPDNFFYKMDLDLNMLWEYPLGKNQVAGGAVMDSQGNLYFVTTTYQTGISTEKNKPWPVVQLELVSLDAAGSLRWKQPITENWSDWQHGMINPAISTDDTIYVAGNRLFAFRPNGNLLWKFPAGDEFFSNLHTSPIIDQAGAVYLIAPQPTRDFRGSQTILAYKFASADAGQPQWATPLDNQVLDNEGTTHDGGGNVGGGSPARFIYSSPAFSLGESSLYAAVGNTLNRVDTSSGAILWSLKPEGATGNFKSSPVVDDQDNVYLGTKSNQESTFFAIRADGSGLLWKKLIGADLYATPLLGDDGAVYFGSEHSSNQTTFHRIDRLTGEIPTLPFKIITPDLSFGSPALSQGFIYFGVYEVHNSADAAFYKVRVPAQGYLPGSPWPRFHGGNQNTGQTQTHH